MTGYARVRKAFPFGEVFINIRSVNHRGLDLRFHHSMELDPLDPKLRAMVKRRISRGHLDIYIDVTQEQEPVPVRINRGIVSAFIMAFRSLQQEFHLPGQPDLNVALRIPGVFQAVHETELPAELTQAVVEAFEEALELLVQFREREGQELVVEFRQRIAIITQEIAHMERIRSEALPALKDRLRQRIAALLEGSSVDEARVLQEAAILAEKTDITEELARLRIHSEELTSLLDSDQEVGKKLDFLLQEMQREINTTLAKSSSIDEFGVKLTSHALTVKAEIEKLREQVMNIE